MTIFNWRVGSLLTLASAAEGFTGVAAISGLRLPSVTVVLIFLGGFRTGNKIN
jgi:hypothetical protein